MNGAFARCQQGFFHFIGGINQIVAGGAFAFHLVVAETRHFKVGRFQVGAGQNQNPNLVAAFNFDNIVTLFVQQVCGNVDRYLGVDFAAVFLQRLFFDQAHDVQRQGMQVTDKAYATAARADMPAGFAQRGAQTLTGQFHQTKARNSSHLHPGPIQLQRVAHAIFDFALIAVGIHVDEVHNDQTTDIPQPQLARNLIRGLQVRHQCGFFDVSTLGGFGGVDVDGHQCFRWINNNGTTGWQLHFALKCRFNLGFNLVAIEQGNVIGIELDLTFVLRHYLTHERQRLLMNLCCVDQNFTDILAQVIPHRPYDHIALLIDQERGRALVGGFSDRTPQGQQVIQIPLQFFHAAANTGRANDDTHVLRNIQGIHHFPQRGTIIAIDTPGNATGTGVIWHQYQVTARQADKRGKGGTLVATFFFAHLQDDFLAFLDHILDGESALNVFGVFNKVFTGDFFQRQEAVTLRAEIHKCGFQAGFNTGDATFINIGFFLFAGTVFDIQIV